MSTNSQRLHRPNGSWGAAVVWLALAAGWLMLVTGLAAPARAAVDTNNIDAVSATIRGAHIAEPLVRTSPTTAAEDAALASAITAYERRSQSEDFSSLNGFLSRYPQSGWAPAIYTNLGLSDLHEGYFSRAIEEWRKAWTLGKDANEPHARALVDRAVGELARLYASVGQFDNLKELFGEMGARPVTGSATEAIQQAGELLVLVKKDPRHLFNCGPAALGRLILAKDAHDRRADALLFYRAGPNGTSLAELGSLAEKAGFAYRLVRRAPGQPVPTMAVVHWKVGHYGVIVGQSHGRYHVLDTAFPASDLWMTLAAIDAESSGHFLVPASGVTDGGWPTVTMSEAEKVWGSGPTGYGPPGDVHDPRAHGGRPGEPPGCGGAGGGSSGNGGGGGNSGMCGYDIKEATVGLTLSDEPVGYSPPLGPKPSIEITFNQREDSQPANFSFYNLSPKWTLNWLTYVTDDPNNPGLNVTRYLAGGGSIAYSGYTSGNGQFAAQQDDGSVLVLVSQSPVTYQRKLGDGSIEIYSQSNNATAYPRNIFLSQVIDPQGKALTLAYDNQLRLTSLTDATGRQTTLSYGMIQAPLLVTQVTDPFGRAAYLTYDSQFRLASITDVIGLTSRFQYDANSLVNMMTTPYGATTFAYTAPSTAGAPRYLQVTDPLGYNEREEWVEWPSGSAPIADSDPSNTVPQGMPATVENQYLSYRDSFYWNKDAYVAAGCTTAPPTISPAGPCNYTMARISHFTHTPYPYVPPGTKSTTIESVRYPLEVNRIWYAYPGQSNGALFQGTFSQPTGIGRVLTDGTTQLSLASYDTANYFLPLQITDPVGRTTSLGYDPGNHIDLLTVSQTIGGVPTITDQYHYNSQHEPLTHIDAAGQTTTFTYTTVGQLQSVTRPLNEKTQYFYDTAFNLSYVINPNNVTSASYTYDGFDRVKTFTDSEGWTVQYTYDNADRVTSTSYPDGTSQTYTYNKLDLASYQDRLGRLWTYTHDADRRLTASTDPLLLTTNFAYNHQGQLTKRTDPRGKATQWQYDVEGRLTSKIYADASTLVTAYDPVTSRVQSVTDALNQVKTFAYAEDDRVTGVAYTGAVNPTPNVSFAYDPNFPRLTSMTDGTGTTTYGYYPVGVVGGLRLQTETQPLATIGYIYDKLGRVKSRAVTGAGSETFGYDALDRLTTHASDLGSFTLGYLGQTGQITTRALASPSNLATTWGYLPNSGDRRLASVATTGLTAGQSTGFAYTTNAENFITGTTQTGDAAVAVPPSVVTQTGTYNNLNQLTNLTGQHLTWDADGNLLKDATRTYSWDAESRLVAISYIGVSGQTTTFSYDGLGRRARIARTPQGGGTTTTNYVWCGSQLCQARTAAGAEARGYYAEGEFVPGSPSASLYYAPDNLGSVRRVFSAGASPSFDYDPYGAPNQTTAPVTDFNYAGTFYNADYNGSSGLYLTTHRPYDPVAGRFLSRDPIGEAGDPAGNLYVYVGGDPLNGIDPEGGAGSRPANPADAIPVLGPCAVIWCPGQDITKPSPLTQGIMDSFCPHPHMQGDQPRPPPPPVYPPADPLAGTKRITGARPPPPPPQPDPPWWLSLVQLLSKYLPH